MRESPFFLFEPDNARLVVTAEGGVKSKRTFTVIIERDEEGWYIATVPALHGCHTQAKNMDVLLKRVREVIELCLKGEDERPGSLELVGIQQIAV